jgi:cell division protease FtsH
MRSSPNLAPRGSRLQDLHHSPGGRRLRLHAAAPTEDRYLLRKTELLDRLDVLLGGRIAEELVFGDISTGERDDLQRATELARHMVTQYGMSDRLRLATFDGPRSPTFLNIPRPQGPREYSEHTAQTIDDEVAKLLAEAHARVEQTLSTNRPTLDRLAKLLLTREVVERSALRAGAATVWPQAGWSGRTPRGVRGLASREALT